MESNKMDEDLHPEIKELRSQLIQERQKSYTLDQKLKSLQRDLASETQQLKLRLQAEQEKTAQLEAYIITLSSSNASDLQLENSVLQSKVASLEKDYNEIKAKLLQDFSSKDLHIVNLAETNQMLEDELKSYQEISLSKTKQSGQKLSKLEDTVNELTIKNQELESSLLSQSTQYEAEIQQLKESLEYTQTQLANKKKEGIRQLEKLESELEVNEKLRGDINSLEIRLRELEGEHEEMLKDIKNREKKLKNLSLEIHNVNEDTYEVNGEEFENLTREVKILTASLKNTKDQCANLMSLKEKQKEKCVSLKQELIKRNEIAEKDKKSLNDQVTTLKSKLDELQKTANHKEDQIKKAKDDIIKELQERILLLKQDKAELEGTLQELQDQIQIGRISSTNEPSLNDELYQLRESYNSRCSTPRNNTLEFKKNEKIINETGEKDLQIQILKAENASLKSQIENLIPSLLNKLPEHQTLLAEKKRLETELALAKGCWANEIDTLKTTLEETEAIAINANLRYAEAATDRDLFYKMYLDIKKPPQKRSWFKKN